jgi:drug/metabolite transporter (DMT)-like permease
MTRKSSIAVVLMLGVMLWFGLQMWINQAGIHASGALAFNSQRYLIAAVTMGIICWVVRVNITKRAVIAGCATGIAYAVMISFESQSLMLESAERSSVLGSLFILFMPILSYITRRRKLMTMEIGGSVVMLLGAWWLFGAPNGNLAGDAFALLRALFYALMLLVVQRFAGEDWRASCFVNLTVVAIFSIGMAFSTGQMQFSLQREVLIPAILSAVIGSVVCCSVLLWSGRYLRSSLFGVLNFLDAPFTVIWGVVLGKGSLTTSSLLAYLLIGLGAVCVLMAGNIRPLRFKLKRTDNRVTAGRKILAVNHEKNSILPSVE